MVAPGPSDPLRSRASLRTPPPHRARMGSRAPGTSARPAWTPTENQPNGTEEWLSGPVGCLSVASETLEAPPDFHDLLRAPNTAVLSTVLPDGSLQGSPVWYWFDGVLVHVSTLAGRQKYRNLRRDPRLALTVFDPAQPLRYIEIRGTAELHDDPDGEMRDRIAVKHGFPDGTAFDPPGAKRVIATIIPTRIRTSSRD